MIMHEGLGFEFLFILMHNYALSIPYCLFYCVLSFTWSIDLYKYESSISGFSIVHQIFLACYNTLLGHHFLFRTMWC